jgi:hypothetical protein
VCHWVLRKGVLVGVLELKDGKGCPLLRGGNSGPFKSLFGLRCGGIAIPLPCYRIL